MSRCYDTGQIYFELNRVSTSNLGGVTLDPTMYLTVLQPLDVYIILYIYPQFEILYCEHLVCAP